MSKGNNKKTPEDVAKELKEYLISVGCSPQDIIIRENEVIYEGPMNGHTH